MKKTTRASTIEVLQRAEYFCEKILERFSILDATGKDLSSDKDSQAVISVNCVNLVNAINDLPSSIKKASLMDLDLYPYLRHSVAHDYFSPPIDEIFDFGKYEVAEIYEEMRRIECIEFEEALKFDSNEKIANICSVHCSVFEIPKEEKQKCVEEFLVYFGVNQERIDAICSLLKENKKHISNFILSKHQEMLRKRRLARVEKIKKESSNTWDMGKTNELRRRYDDGYIGHIFIESRFGISKIKACFYYELEHDKNKWDVKICKDVKSAKAWCDSKSLEHKL